MAELSGLFQNLGPTTASLMSGIQAGQQYNENEAMQQQRAAQLEKTLQDTRQAEAMNPLLLQAKQQDIAAAELKAKQDKETYRDEVMGKAIPILAQTPPLQRHARMEELFTQAGLPLDQADKQHLYSLDPDQLVKEMKSKYEWAITQNPQYRREMDKQRLHNQGMLNVESARETARATRESDKAKRMTTYDAQIAAAKGDANKAAVARQWAMKTDDAYERAEFERQAKVYDAAAMERNPAKIKADADQAAMERLTGKQRPLGPVKDLSVTDMRNAL